VTSECTYEFPAGGKDSDSEEELHAELRVINDAFWIRLCTMGDLGFAEAYMFGDVACEDLISTFLVSILSSLLSSYSTSLTLEQVFLKNKDNLASLNSTLSWLFSLPQRLTSFRFLNSLGNARSNISAHYDLSDDMFKGLNLI
jgi:cyclopropane-fatty-acyl-phospholipid synthase